MGEWKSTEIGEIAGALAAAQAEFGKLVASKTAEIKTKGSGRDYRYTYANLADALEACRATLNKHGIAVIQMPATSARNGIEVSTMLVHSSGQWLRSEEPLFMPVSGGAQDVGSAITYGRRYSLLAMVGLAPEDDDGKAAQSAKPDRWGDKRARAAPERREPPRSSLGPRCSAGVAGVIVANIKALAAALDWTGPEVWEELLARARVDLSAYQRELGGVPKQPKQISKKDAALVKKEASVWLAELATERIGDKAVGEDPTAENAP